MIFLKATGNSEYINGKQNEFNGLF